MPIKNGDNKCSIEGCERKTYAHGICQKHYRKQWRIDIHNRNIIKICDKCGTSERYKSGDCKQCYSIYRAINKKKISASRKQYYQDHAEEEKARARQGTLDIKVETFNAYGGCRCVECGIEDIDVLTIDHINGGGNKHRKELGLSSGGSQFYKILRKQNFPGKDKYRVLCFNCQFVEEEKHKVLKNNKRAIYVREERHRLKIQTFNAYGGCKCGLCNILNVSCLSIDHIDGSGGEHRKELDIGSSTEFYRWLRRNSWPSGYRVLCMNCQIKEDRSIRYGK